MKRTKTFQIKLEKKTLVDNYIRNSMPRFRNCEFSDVAKREKTLTHTYTHTQIPEAAPLLSERVLAPPRKIQAHSKFKVIKTSVGYCYC